MFWQVCSLLMCVAQAASKDNDNDDKINKPNIVLVIVDDLGWNDVSYRGGNEVRTPVFDSLVQNGVLLDRAYAYSWCGPSRSSLLSGRMPTHVSFKYGPEVSVDPLNPASSGVGIPASMLTVGGKLKEANYRTHYNGKWGVGYYWPKQAPRARGYDTFLGYLQDSVDFYTGDRAPTAVNTPGGCEEEGFDNPYIIDYWRNDGPADKTNNTGWMDKIFLQESLKNIKDHDSSNRDKPLLLIHSFHSVHTPLDPPAEVLNDGGYPTDWDQTRRAYASMATFVDTSVGKIVDALKEKKMWDNTLLVMTSDNGGPIYPGNSEILHGGADNFPLRGGKTVEFEGGVRVNSFAAGGVIPAKMRGKTITDYVHVADWFGTFASLAGLDQYDKLAAKAGLPQPDSINIWPLLSGKATKPRRTSMHISPTLYYENNWKFISGADLNNIVGRLALEPTKIQFNFVRVGYPPAVLQPFPVAALDCANGCLFDVHADPSEVNEVGDENPAIRQQMSDKLKELNKKNLNTYLGPATVNIEACTAMQAVGFYGPWATSNAIKNWKFESKTGRLSD